MSIFEQPAFPTYERQQSQGVDTGLDLTCSGMTLRDYFAAKAMQGLVNDGLDGMRIEHIDHVAGIAYRIANAMMKAREAEELKP
jgi:hypothetical protein